MKIELKGIKGHQGHDSFCFTATLMVDGKKRGQVSDDGNGGALFFSDFAAQKEINEYGATLPQKNFPAEWGGGSYRQDADTLVGDLLEDYQEQRRLKALCKKKTVFSTGECRPGDYLTINEKFSPQMKVWVLSRHPDAVFINERVV